MTAGTKATHTSGPWVAGEPDGSYHDVIRIYAETDTDREKPIAVCFQQNSAIMEVIRGATNKTTVAAKNAALISAAPDMLAALKGAEEWLKGFASAEPYLTVIQDAILKAEAAQ